MIREELNRRQDLFDYSDVIKAPEVILRVERLERRLRMLGGGEIDKEQRVLEVGVGSGDVTEMLAKYFRTLTCVDLEKENIKLAKNRVKNRGGVKFICKDMADMYFPHQFDQIILFGILEHLVDPVLALAKLAPWLADNGRMHVLVNNASSIHRWVGVALGMMESVEDLTESDIKLGHYRVYTVPQLREHVNEAGLTVLREELFYMKPLPTSMMASLPMKIHKAFDELGEKFPEFASYMYFEVGHGSS